MGQLHFFIVAGGGYPNIFNTIENAISDIEASSKFDRLVVSVDSEDKTLTERMGEIKDFVNEKQSGNIDVKIIVQHFCIETWLLGNMRIFRRNPLNPKLRELKAHFDVQVLDPEDLGPMPRESINRAQTAYKYLRMALRDRYRNITYSKGNPKDVMTPTYFSEVRRRLLGTGHIQSFSAFIDAFI
jgi:hypothetical protein